ncbi:MAG: transposase [Actinobacteria bacterium]|nr:transposase [Actinomycetota bacterium]
MPRCWTDDPARCAQAGGPADRGFATKPQLVIGMLDRARAAGVPFRYFAADAGYGRDPALRAWCHTHDVPYVMAVPARPAAGRPARAAHPSRPGAGHREPGGVGTPLLRQAHLG